MLIAETIQCTYVELGKPVEVGNYEWRGKLFRVTDDMIREAVVHSGECRWQFRPYVAGSKIAFYDAVGRA